MRKLVTKLEAGSLKLDKEWRQENPFIVENNIVSGRSSSIKRSSLVTSIVTDKRRV